MVNRTEELLESSRAMVVKLQDENRLLRECLALDMQRDVRDFMVKFGQYHQNKPNVPTAQIRSFRIKLIREEVGKELIPALKEDNLPEIADAIVDSMYVIIGTAISYGINIYPLWVKVHNYNMNKIPVSGSENKPLKNGTHPNVEEKLELQLR